MIDYVFIKLTTGEQLMAMLESEDGSHVAISHPMVIRLTPIDVGNGRMHENVTATPFCKFSEGDDFVLPKSSIMFIKQLSSTIINHYKSVVEQYEHATLRTDRSQEKRKVSWAGEEEEMSVEEIRKRIELLESIYAGDRTEEAEEEYEKNFIEGNDTLH
jgi:hypothetical protein